jgi:voltage-gated potassium channel
VSATLDRLTRRLEWPLLVLALLVIPALIVENQAETPGVRLAAGVANWVIWLGFLADFLLRWAAARRWSYLRDAWFDAALLIITPPILVPDFIQGMRSLRAIRLLSLLRTLVVTGMLLRLARRLFGRRKFHYVGALALVIVLLGAVGVYLVERGQNPAIGGFGDAIWWAMVTATTVGYGDVSPVTVEGRFIAVLLMLVGIGVIGVFTATVAGYFVHEEEASTDRDVQARLAAIEAKLDEILRRGAERP